METGLLRNAKTEMNARRMNNSTVFFMGILTGYPGAVLLRHRSFQQMNVWSKINRKINILLYGKGHKTAMVRVLRTIAAEFQKGAKFSGFRNAFSVFYDRRYRTMFRV